MKNLMIWIASLFITALLVILALTFKDPLPPLIAAILSLPVWLFTFMIVFVKDKSFDVVEWRNNNNLNQIRINTDRMK